MPDSKSKKAEKKSVLDLIDEIIADLEFKIGQYNDRINLEAKQASDAGVDPGEVNLRIENMKKEVSILNKQLSITKSARTDFEMQLNKAKNEEEKKNIENTLKTAYYMGVINENLRIRREEEIEAEKTEAKLIIETAKTVSSVLSKNQFNFITYDDVKDIADNEEFKQMYKTNPYQIDYDNKKLYEDYKDMMRRRMTRVGMVVTDDFKELEQAYNKNYLPNTENNGYESALKFVRGSLTTLHNLLRVEKDPNAREKLSADIEKMEEIDELLAELAAQTIKINQRFKDDEFNFKRGNGYTKELIAMSQTLERKLNDFHKELGDRLNKTSIMDTLQREVGTAKKTLDVENPGMKAIIKEINDTGYKKEKAENLVPILTTISMVKSKVEPQIQDDQVMFRINEQRKKGEMWRVFQELQGEDVEKAKLSPRAKMEKDSIEKANRIKAKGKKAGGFLDYTASAAAAAAQNMLVYAMAKGPMAKATLNDFAKQDVIRAMAIITLNHILYNENSTGKKINLDRITGYKVNPYERFMNMAEGLAEDKKFQKAVSGFFDKKGNSKYNALKFLATDGEVEIAKKFAGKEIKIIDKQAKADAAMHLPNNK